MTTVVCYGSTRAPAGDAISAGIKPSPKSAPRGTSISPAVQSSSASVAWPRLAACVVCQLVAALALGHWARVEVERAAYRARPVKTNWTPSKLDLLVRRIQLPEL